ncbi:hypothetical protein M0813_27549 [Anaeramoeba flamelloides]|uniref:BTB domain-containing protein n=1 Tax=Anaeramoeba flamelloides TaxID=1746091 RepID=A0ABQ8XZE4_9EUKA|nr:hypothetical protein M0813_27549 [Anaeramoeba flamelloides]
MSQTQPRIFISGSPFFNNYYLSKNTNELTWTAISKIENILKINKIVSATDNHKIFGRSHLLIWTGKSQLELYEKEKETKIFKIENEQIKDIQCGDGHYLILTKSGKVYSLSNYNYYDYQKIEEYSKIPLEDFKESQLSEIVPVPFFNNKKNNCKVKSLAMCYQTNYFLCYNGKLYGNGYNKNGYLGDKTTKSKNKPCIIFEDVKRVFGGMGAQHFFFITKKSRELFSCGYNLFGQCSIGKTKNKLNSPQKVPDWNANDILEIHCFAKHTILITKDGKTYSCGSGESNGIGEYAFFFQEIPKLKNKKPIKVTGGKSITLYLSTEKKLYGWGFSSNKTNRSYKKINTDNYWLQPRKIHLPDVFENNLIPFDCSCGIDDLIYLYPNYVNILKQDLKLLFRSKKYCDSKLIIFKDNKKEKEKTSEIVIPIHRLIVELRTRLKIEQIGKIFNEKRYNKKEINLFLQWIYYDEINFKILNFLQKAFKALKLTFPPQNSLEKDLLKLYNDNESKDFSIYVEKKTFTNQKNRKQNKNKKRKENEKIMETNVGNEKPTIGEEQDKNKQNKKINKINEEKEYERIKVHKLILLTRSKLFSDMFDNLNEEEKNINQIRDYTGKSKDSIEILMKYFYTDKMDLNENELFKIDPELIFEELEDSIEYYQLNENGNLIEELNQIKNKQNVLKMHQYLYY